MLCLSSSFSLSRNSSVPFETIILYLPTHLPLTLVWLLLFFFVGMLWLMARVMCVFGIGDFLLFFVAGGEFAVEDSELVRWQRDCF